MRTEDDMPGGTGGAPRFRPVPGDNVHFYTRDARLWAAGVNEGPYAAMVTRVFEVPAGTPSLVCLTVFPPMGAPYCVPSVEAKAERGAEPLSCWWTELPL
jgi:hypothetical protein